MTAVLQKLIRFSKEYEVDRALPMRYALRDELRNLLQEAIKHMTSLETTCQLQRSLIHERGLDSLANGWNKSVEETVDKKNGLGSTAGS